MHPDQQLYVYSLSMGKKISSEQLSPTCQVYSAGLSKLDKGKYIAIVGSESDRAYIFDTESMELFTSIQGIQSPIY